MNAMFRPFVAIFLSLSLIAGCTLLSDENSRLRLATYYSVMKVIEQSEDVTAQGVIDAVVRVRNLVDTETEVTVRDLVDRAIEVLGVDNLGPSDRFLVTAVLLEYSDALEKRVGKGILADEDKVAIYTLLDWIDSAARMAA